MAGGRPTAMDEMTLKKLEEAFSNGATDREACFLANISQQTLYNYQKEHVEFIERKESLKDMIKYQAKIKVKEAIEKENKPDTAKWYLEKRDKEFKPKQDITTNEESLNNEPVLDKVLKVYANNLRGENTSDTGIVL
jgi:hypothetical protein